MGPIKKSADNQNMEPAKQPSGNQAAIATEAQKEPELAVQPEVARKTESPKEPTPEADLIDMKSEVVVTPPKEDSAPQKDVSLVTVPEEDETGTMGIASSPSTEKKRQAPKAPSKEENQLTVAKLEPSNAIVRQKSPLASRNIQRVDDSKTKQQKTGWL